MPAPPANEQQLPGRPASGERPESGDDRRLFIEALLDEITAGVVTVNQAGNVTFANRMAIETLGTALENCLGREVGALFGESQLVRNAIRGLPQGGETRLDFTFGRSDGRRFDVGMTVIRPKGRAPAGMTFVLLFRDLEDRRQFEMELRRIERLNAIGNMVAGFAHELRNPLAGIQALAEALLAETSESDPRREYIRRMLLLFQRVESFVKASVRFGEPKPAVRRDHQPFEILDAALGALTPRWGKGGSPPVTRVELELPPIRIDESQVVEGLLALIENAIDATGSPARVRIHVHREPGGRGGAAQVKSLVRFDVQDDGPGIPESMLSRVFDPFFTTKPKGTGLGLPLAQALVRENGGRLEVRSVPGVETVFSVILPEASETP